jgi:hypothetical protein
MTRPRILTLPGEDIPLRPAFGPSQELAAPVKRMTTMIDEQMARMRTHRNNIYRYRHLLQTKLTELERDFIEKRLAEEQSNLDRLAVSGLTFALPHPATSAAWRAVRFGD